MAPKNQGPEQVALGRAIDERRIESSLIISYRRLQLVNPLWRRRGEYVAALPSPDPLIPYPFFPFNTVARTRRRAACISRA